jgi:hypothetical protein
VVVSKFESINKNFYRFLCPDCKRIVSKSASLRVVNLLVDSGVLVEYLTSPVENITMEGPVFNLEDVLNFHIDLKNDEVIEIAVHDMMQD